MTKGTDAVPAPERVDRPTAWIPTVTSRLVAAGVPGEALGKVLEIIKLLEEAKPGRVRRYPGIGRALASERVPVQPQRRRAMASIGRLFPNGVPSPDALTSGDLVKAVQDDMQANGERTVDRSTILRAAERRSG